MRKAFICPTKYVQGEDELLNLGYFVKTFGDSALLIALDSDVERLQPIPGMLPDPSIEPKGCPFVERCAKAAERCRTQKPELRSAGGTHTVRCHFAQEVIA